MKIYTRRNAAVGYLTLKALQRQLDRKRGRRRSGYRVAAYVGLGLVSAGILAAALAIALRRRAAEVAEGEASFDGDNEIVGEYVTTPEPAPAT
jgi:DMSO reductase anchor subunit